MSFHIANSAFLQEVFIEMASGSEIDKELHERLMIRDPTASEEIATRYLESVRRYVRGRALAHGITDGDLINDATVDALFDYIQHPEKFHPDKSTLKGYLNRAAERDLINAVRKDRRRRRGEELSNDVELAILSGNRQAEIQKLRSDVEEQLISTIDGTPTLDTVLAIVKLPKDQTLLKLMVEGERRTSAFARVLGIEHLSTVEQRRIVKRHKDRLKQHLKRAGGKHRAR